MLRLETATSKGLFVTLGGDDGLPGSARHWRVASRAFVDHHRQRAGRYSSASPPFAPSVEVGILQAKAARSHSQRQPASQGERIQRRVHLLK